MKLTQPVETHLPGHWMGQKMAETGSGGADGEKLVQMVKWVLVFTIRMQNACSRVKAVPGLVPADLTSLPPFTLWAVAHQPHLTLHVLFPVGSYTSHAHCLQHPLLCSSFGSYSASDPGLISLPHSATPRTLTPQGPRRGPSWKC